MVDSLWHNHVLKLSLTRKIKANSEFLPSEYAHLLCSENTPPSRCGNLNKTKKARLFQIAWGRVTCFSTQGAVLAKGIEWNNDFRTWTAESLDKSSRSVLQTVFQNTLRAWGKSSKSRTKICYRQVRTSI